MNERKTSLKYQGKGKKMRIVAMHGFAVALSKAHFGAKTRFIVFPRLAAFKF